MKSTKINNSIVLEVLIATLNRTSISFIKKMFPHNELEHLNLLIINQTKIGSECFSEYENIRVINSYEAGLSKSRNLALKNAIGDICLIADDDVEYLPNFEQTIYEAFLKQQSATVIQFKIETFSGVVYKKYLKSSKKLIRNKDFKNVSSIEIAFNRKHIMEKGILFNPLFGLGSNCFQSGEEYLFLKEVYKKGLNVYFKNMFIVKHKLERSTSNQSSNSLIKTKAALYFYDYKNLSYLFLFKLILFLLRKQLIVPKEAVEKYRVGISAINKYKEMKKIDE